MQRKNMLRNPSLIAGNLAPSEETQPFLDWAIQEFNYRVANFENEIDAFKFDVEVFRKEHPHYLEEQERELSKNQDSEPSPVR